MTPLWLFSLCLLCGLGTACVVARARNSYRSHRRLGLLGARTMRWRVPRVAQVVQNVVAGWRGSVALAGLAGVGTLFVAGPVGAALASVYGLAGIRILRAFREERQHRQLLRWCADAFSGIADDVRAGQHSDDALAQAAHTMHNRTGAASWRKLSEAAASGADIVAALRCIPSPCDRPCAKLAAVWQLLDAGIPVAEIVSRLDSELRSWRKHAEELTSETAAASATVAVLALLPFVGIAMGFLLGANPLRVLLHTPLGAACAMTGACLQLAGWSWARAIANPRRLASIP